MPTDNQPYRKGSPKQPNKSSRGNPVIMQNMQPLSGESDEAWLDRVVSNVKKSLLQYGSAVPSEPGQQAPSQPDNVEEGLGEVMRNLMLDQHGTDSRTSAGEAGRTPE
tara:strand:+ start:464 stop:787 length:324 start_codon:yes stop_codon:yes gene_type:complete